MTNPNCAPEASPRSCCLVDFIVRGNPQLTPLNRGLRLGLLLGSLGICLFLAPAEAALPAAPPPVPNPNRFRSLPTPPTPGPLTPGPVVAPPVPPSPVPLPPAASLLVQNIQVVGSTVFTQADFQPILSPLEGHRVTLLQLQQAADAITQLYLDRGYITSRAVLVNQRITNGLVQIRVVEGHLQSIELSGTKRLFPHYILTRLRLANRGPLNIHRLEDQLQLLKTDPLLANIQAQLEPGQYLGESKLIVTVQEANPFFSDIFADNYSPPSNGSERFGFLFGIRDLSGLGDELSVAYDRTTTGGANVFDFDYRVPLNAMNGTLLVRAAPYSSNITEPPFNSLGINSQSSLYQISFRQPLIRTPRQELALSLGFTYEQGQSFIANNIPFPFGIGPNANGISTTSVFQFGQDYLRRDPHGAWYLQSQFSLGVGILGATINPGTIPDGRFFSWLGQLERAEALGHDRVLILQGEVQLTPNTLLPSQQFVIGGGESVRGYSQNARFGDNGFRLSAEARLPIQRDAYGTPIVQLAPFIDAGDVWNTNGNPNLLPPQTFLLGAGVGVLWDPFKDFHIRLDYGYPFINLVDRGNNLQDAGFYFSAHWTR